MRFAGCATGVSRGLHKLSLDYKYCMHEQDLTKTMVQVLDFIVYEKIALITCQHNISYFYHHKKRRKNAPLVKF